MDVLGKKTPGQREDEEAERLVRPLPKKKPPRHDKRRERMDADRDPDIDADKDLKGDPDLSMNYKTIGGSGLMRVVKLAKESDRVKVRRKEDGKIVEVSKDTLRERGGDYEKYDPSEDSGEEDERVQELATLFEKDPNVKDALRGILRPDSGVLEYAEAMPDAPASSFTKAPLPPSIKTVRELVEVAQKAFSLKPKKPEKAKAPKKPKKPDEKPQAEPENPTEGPEDKEQKAPDQLPPEAQEAVKNLVKLIPEGGVGKDKPKDESSKAEEPNGEAPKSEEVKPDETPAGEPEGEKKPKEKPVPQRRVPTESEVHEARQLVMDTFPPRMASKFANMHPDDVRSLVSNFNEFKSLGPIEPANIESELAKVGKITFNPDKIEPPEKVMWAGEEVKVADLPPEEQQEAIQQHRMAVMGAQLALRSRAIKSMKKAGTPPKLAQKLTDFLLGTNGMSPEERMKKAQEKSKDLFASASSEDLVEEDARFGVPKSKAGPDKGTVAASRKKALSSVKDPAAKALLVAAFQGEDYRQMVKDHFSWDGKNTITEKDSTKSVMEKIKQAENFFKERAKNYPEDLRMGLDDPSSLFRVRVRQAVRDLDPVKAKRLSKYLAREEASAFDDAQRDYQKALKDYRERLRKWMSSGSEENPPMAPKAPTKPATYDSVKGGKDPVGTKAKMDKLLGGKKASYSSYPPFSWQTLLARLGGDQQDQNGSRGFAAASQAEETMTIKFATEDANRILGRLDKMATAIQDNHEKWGMDFATAKALVNDLDRTADEIEKAAFGEDSFTRRQVEVLKSAKVIQQDSDESYMGTYNAPMAPVQTDSDEGYMSQFKDDQSQAVATGKSTTGRPLAP